MAVSTSAELGVAVAPQFRALRLSTVRQQVLVLTYSPHSLGRRLLKVPVADPMSGFFMLRREAFATAVHNLSSLGFKIPHTP